MAHHYRELMACRTQLDGDLRGGAVIVLEQPTESFACFDLSTSVHDFACNDLVAQSLMWSFPVVMLKVLLE